jgi:hypothetical protein
MRDEVYAEYGRREGCINFGLLHDASDTGLAAPNVRNPIRVSEDG